MTVYFSEAIYFPYVPYLLLPKRIKFQALVK